MAPSLLPVAEMLRSAAGLSLVLSMLVGCAPDAPAELPPDYGPDGLYADFWNRGKFDELGHPFGAEVVPLDDCEGQASCAAQFETGSGSYALNLRAKVALECADIDCSAPAIDIRVTRDGDVVAARTILASQFDRAGAHNLALRFSLGQAGPLEVEVSRHTSSIELDYLELFRATDSIRIEPPSGPVPEDGMIHVEYQGQSAGQSTVEIDCAGGDLGERVAERIESGELTVSQGEFRSVVDIPFELVSSACPEPYSVLARARQGTWVRAAARASYGYSPPDCSFSGSGVRVLLTGFEPFPADSTGDNSSEQAVLAFDATSIEGISVMRMILPVEWWVAYERVGEVARRCDAEVVLSFGQGRGAIDVERFAYNLMDTSAVPGGVPDNRGVVESGTVIEAMGPAKVETRIPATTIVEALRDRGFSAQTSTDPGRYICNDLFYETTRGLAEHTRASGFIHMPHDSNITPAERDRLGEAVEVVVQTVLDSLDP